MWELIDDDRIARQLVESSDNGRSEKWRFARNEDRINEFKRIDIAFRLPSIVKTISCTNFCYFYNLKQMRTLIEYNFIKLSRDRVSCANADKEMFNENFLYFNSRLSHTYV